MRITDRLLKSELTGDFIFGSMDGLVSVFGVIIGLAAATKLKIVDASIGLAAASAISMAFGEYLGDAKKSVNRAVIMGVATLFGTLVPILPLVFLPKLAGFIVCGVMTVPFGALVGAAERKGRKGYVQTYVMLYTAILVTVIVSLLTGAGG